MKILLMLMVCVALMIAMTTNAALVGEWLFNEGSGDIAKDTSGNNNDGTIDKAQWTKDGKYGAALKFDGATSSVVIKHADILVPQDAATVTVWAYLSKAPAAGAIESIFSKGGNHKDFDLQVESDMLIKWYVSSTPTNYNVISKTQMPLNEWVFIAATYVAKDAISLYVNGKLENTTKMAEGRDASSEPIRIGISFWANRFWNGMLDEVRLFDTALSEADIKEMMTKETPVDPAGRLTVSWGKIKSE
jgi:hypothetical protein